MSSFFRLFLLVLQQSPLVFCRIYLRKRSEIDFAWRIVADLSFSYFFLLLYDPAAFLVLIESNSRFSFENQSPPSTPRVPRHRPPFLQ